MPMTKDLRDVLRERERRRAEERERASAAPDGVVAASESVASESVADEGVAGGVALDGSAANAAATNAAASNRAPLFARLAGGFDRARGAHGASSASTDAADSGPADWRDEESPLASLRRPIVLAAMLFTFALGVYLRPFMVARAVEPLRSDAPMASVDALRQMAGVAANGSRLEEAPADGRAVLDPAAAAGASAVRASLALDLLDPVNRVTVQVITYRDRAAMQDLAQATVHHLIANGIGAIGPLRVRNDLVVLAGAAPRVEDLADLRERIAALPDPAGRQDEYADALVRNIDDFVAR